MFDIDADTAAPPGDDQLSSSRLETSTSPCHSQQQSSASLNDLTLGCQTSNSKVVQNFTTGPGLWH